MESHMKSRYTSIFFCIFLGILCTLPPILLLVIEGINSIASYRDFVLGEIAYSGYNKSLELHIILLFIFCDFLLLPFLIWHRQKILTIYKLCNKKLSKIFNALINKFLLFSNVLVSHLKTSNLGLILLGFLYLLFQSSGIKSREDILVYFIVAGTYLILIALLRRRLELFTHTCMAGIGCYFSLIGVLVACEPTVANFNLVRLWGIPASCIATLGAACWLRGHIVVKPAKVVAMAWTLAPCLLFALPRWSYIHGSTPVDLYASWFSGKYFDISVIVILFIAILAFLLRKYAINYLISAVVVGVYLSWHAPSPYIPLDFFHAGEITTPLQQLLQFGKKPLLDYHPVHGMCDYYFFCLSHLFFDGSYASINAGIALGTSFQTALQIIVFYIICPNRYMPILLAIVFPNLGTRWLAVGLCLPLSLWLFQRCNAIWFLLWSGFTGLCCIFWNVPQGAAYCAALIPLIIAKFLKRHKFSLPRPTRAQIASAFMLCLVILALLPYIHALVSTTLLTGQLAVEAHGRAILEDLHTAAWPAILGALLFLPFLAYLYILALTTREKSTFLVLLPVSLTFFCLIAINYTFLRYDGGGWRAAMMGLLLIAATITAVRFPRGPVRFGGYFFLMTALLLNPAFHLPLSYTRMYENQVLVLGKDFVLPSRQVLSSIGNLGLGFIKPESLDKLQEFRTYLDNNGNIYANIDNNLAYYCIFNSENYLKYQTSFNTEGIKKQNDSLKRIDKKNLNIVILPLHFRKLRRPLYYFHIQLLKRGFYPDAILGNEYLVLKRGPKEEDEVSSAETVLLNTPGIWGLQHVPQVWSPACASLTSPVSISYQLSLKNCIRSQNGAFMSQRGGTVRITLHFAKPVSPRDFQFICLSSSIGGKNLLVRVTSPDIADGKNGYSFWLGQRAAALPLFLNYAWLFSPGLHEINLEIRDARPGKDFTLDIGFRRFLPEKD